MNKNIRMPKKFGLINKYPVSHSFHRAERKNWNNLEEFLLTGIETGVGPGETKHIIVLNITLNSNVIHLNAEQEVNFYDSQCFRYYSQ